jgi:hypothetical protein
MPMNSAPLGLTGTDGLETLSGKAACAANALEDLLDSLPASTRIAKNVRAMIKRIDSEFAIGKITFSLE